MSPRSSTGAKERPIVRIANILAVLALAAMLIGAVTLLLAREHSGLMLNAGEEEVVMEVKARSFDPWGAEMKVEVYPSWNATANVTLTATETTGTGKAQNHTDEVPPGSLLRWNERAQHGEEWSVQVTNHGNESVRVVATVSQMGNYWIGGALVGFGIAGFVFHRIDMRAG